MKVDKDNNTATLDFEENWSMNGAFVYDMLEKKMIPGPTKYPITVKYEILWEYEKGERVPKDPGPGFKCVNWQEYSKTRTGTVTAEILVDGTGKTRYAQ